MAIKTSNLKYFPRFKGPKQSTNRAQTKDSYMRGQVRKNQTKQYAWESNVFKRLGVN